MVPPGGSRRARADDEPGPRRVLVPPQSRLLTTDGVRLDTIKVIWPTGDPAERKPLAVDLAHVYVGPLVKPPGY